MSETNASREAAAVRHLIAMETRADRRAAWTLVQRKPVLLNDVYQSALRQTGIIGDCQIHSFVSIHGYEFEQITHPFGREILLGEFAVDYDEPLLAKIRSALDVMLYRTTSGCDTDITAQHFPPTKVGKRVSKLALINTGSEYPVLAEFEAMTKQLSRVDGDIYQGMEVVKRFPYLMRSISMIAPGSRWQNPAGDLVAPVLHMNQAHAWLHLSHLLSSQDQDDWRRYQEVWAIVSD